MAKKFHLIWFGAASGSNWANSAGALYDWRQPEIYQDIARLCERAKFDACLFADGLAVPAVLGGSRDWYVRHGIQVTQDPAPTLAMMAAATSKIGLACTLSSTFYPPYLLARLLATLDHLTRGRVGWNLVTTAGDDAAQNFGLDEMLEHDARYDRADEYVALCRALWDSWEPDAVVMDRTSNTFALPEKVHAVDFEGKYFRSKGPLTVTSSPQRNPVISVAGTSPRGTRFAAKHGDMAISHKNSIPDMRNYVQSLRQLAAEEGRDPASIKVFFSIKPVIGETEAAAKEQWARNYEAADEEEGMAILSNYLSVDLMAFDRSKPLPRDLHVPGMRGTFQRYLAMPEGTPLRSWAKEEGMHETFPVCGTPEHVADVLEQAVVDTDCDGFHFRPAHGFTDYEYCLQMTTRLVPVLQRRGLVRSDYTGTTLRHHLTEF